MTRSAFMNLLGVCEAIIKFVGTPFLISLLAYESVCAFTMAPSVTSLRRA